MADVDNCFIDQGLELLRPQLCERFLVVLPLLLNFSKTFDIVFHSHFLFSAVIFVVDSTNLERIPEAHEELAKLMAEKRLKDALLLVYVNKQVKCAFSVLQVQGKTNFNLPVPSLLVLTPYTGGGGGEGSGRTPFYLKNRCPHEHEILHGIRKIVKHPRNVKVSYIVINWLP